MAAKDAADGVGRDPVAELEQCALDATITPTRVLAAQPQDQFATADATFRGGLPAPAAHIGAASGSTCAVRFRSTGTSWRRCR